MKAKFLALLFLCPALCMAAETPKWKALPAPTDWDIFKNSGENSLRTSSAVEAYLHVLAAQMKDGRLLKPDGQLNDRINQVGLTSLGLLAFMGAGYTHKSGHFKETVSATFQAIQKQQKDDGQLADGLLNHALACMVLCELHGMTRGTDVVPVRKGLDFLLRQQKDSGGFPATLGGKEPDMTTSVLAAMIFKSARLSGLKVDDKAVEKLTNYFDKSLDPKTGLILNAEGKPDLQRIAGAALALQFLGASRDDKRINKLVAALVADPPSHDHPDFLHWYWGQLACFMVGGESWKTWYSHSKPCLVEHIYLRENGSAKEVPAEIRAKVSGIIKAMGSDDFATREAASREAVSLPVTPAVAAILIEPYRQHKDPEVAKRVEAACEDLYVRAVGEDPYAVAWLALTMEVYYRYLPVTHN